MPIDYKKYPSNWKSEIRPSVLKRANNSCECCGVDNYMTRRFVDGKSQTDNYENQTYAEAKALAEHMNSFCDDGLGKWSIVVLTIAHLDHDISNNDLSNLKALCQKCHLSYDKDLHKENSRQTRKVKQGLLDLPLGF